MKISYKDVHTSSVTYYDVDDVLDFGKHTGIPIRTILYKDPSYIDRLLETQVGFGLNEEAMCHWQNNGNVNEYPDGKLPLTETKTISIKQHKSINHLPPVIGVNIMKKAIMVTHDSKFQHGKEVFYGDSYEEYSYLTEMDDLGIDDFVVADCAKGLKVCRVTRVMGLTTSQIDRAHKWIVSRVDMTQHLKNLEIQENIQEIQNKVQERKKQIEGQIILKQMAAEDPTMMELLKKLGGLDANLVPACLLEKPKKRKARGK